MGRWKIKIAAGYLSVIFFLFPGLILQADEMHDAIETGDIAKIRSLLSTNPSLVNAENRDGVTPLHTAVVSGCWDVIELLLA